MKKVNFGVILTILLLGLLASAVHIQTVRAGTVTVPDEYPTIQAALDHANNGSIVYVRNGIYDENLDIEKDSLTLIGESEQAFINGTIQINANDVTIKQFKIADAVTYIIPGSNSNLDDLTQPIIYLSGCYNTTIIGNTIEGYVVEYPTWFESYIGGVGCELAAGGNNVIRNNVFDSLAAGIFIGDESNDSVIGNDLNWMFDVSLFLSGYNTTIYHNNFYAHAVTLDSNNDTWDNGYPSGGNYWSDYQTNYPDAVENDSSGIWNTPYVIGANSIDHYPLMSPWIHISGDLNDDGKVGLDDLVLLAQTYGTRLGDSNWNPLADVAPPYGIIGLTDLVTLAMHYGQHYP